MTEPAIPAATLVVMHERGDGPPELLMVERTARMAFAGRAMVFRGRPIEEACPFLAPGNSEPDAAPRIAAIRETLEESGIAIGMAPDPGQELAGRLQNELHDGTPFGELLAANGLGLRLGALTTFAR